MVKVREHNRCFKIGKLTVSGKSIVKVKRSTIRILLKKWCTKKIGGKSNRRLNGAFQAKNALCGDVGVMKGLIPFMLSANTKENIVTFHIMRIIANQAAYYT